MHISDDKIIEIYEQLGSIRKTCLEIKDLGFPISERRISRLVNINHLPKHGMSPNKFKRHSNLIMGVIGGDIHLEYDYDMNDNIYARLFVEFIRKYSPDLVVLNGDIMDLNCISDFNKSKPKNIEGSRLKADFEVTNKFIRSFRDHTRKIVYIEGNHEERIGRAIASNPQGGEGYWELERNIQLVDEFVLEYNNYMKNYFQIGPLKIIHGYKASITAARLYIQDYMSDIIANHNHQFQHFCKMLSNGRVLNGFTNSCLCDRNPSYLKSRVPNWQNGFMVFYYEPETNHIDYFPAHIFNGRLNYKGEIIKL
jgi:UDP-2,3-diacylglucosamine pyrophosphatase LpxH